MNSPPNERDALERLYRLHRSIPFPPSHSDLDIQEVHDHLIVYDAEVAGLVSRVLEGDNEAKEMLKGFPWLRERIVELRERERGARELLDRYLDKYDRLARMVELARRTAPP